MDVCVEVPFSGGPSRNFSSPFVLALSGLIVSRALGALEHADVLILEEFLSRVDVQLSKAPSRDGWYDFFGCESYPADADTTSIVHLYLLERGLVKAEDLESVIGELIANRSPSSGALLTWRLKEPNSVDWGVNLNAHLLFLSTGTYLEVIDSYLADGLVWFARNGSKYYMTPLPLLAMCALLADLIVARSPKLGMGLRDSGLLPTGEVWRNKLFDGSLLPASGSLKSGPEFFRASAAVYRSPLLTFSLSLAILCLGEIK